MDILAYHCYFIALVGYFISTEKCRHTNFETHICIGIQYCRNTFFLIPNAIVSKYIKFNKGLSTNTKVTLKNLTCLSFSKNKVQHTHCQYWNMLKKNETTYSVVFIRISVLYKQDKPWIRKKYNTIFKCIEVTTDSLVTLKLYKANCVTWKLLILSCNHFVPTCLSCSRQSS